MNTLVWQSIYCFMAEPFEPFLRTVLHPWAQAQRAQGRIAGYFFIRYWEGGPHLRFRFQAPPQPLEALSQAWETLLAEHPSAIRTVREAYQPETNRYGGPASLPLAEKLFEASSDAVLTALEQHPEWDYSSGLSQAIPLHWLLATALFPTPAGALEGLRAYFEHWKVLAYRQLGETLPEAERQERESKALAQFDHLYTQQRDHLLPWLATLVEGIAEGAELPEPLAAWRTATLPYAEGLHQLNQNGQLLLPTLFGRFYEGAFSASEARLLAQLDNHIHMTNNRLGIFNQDEAYLAYLMHRGISEALGQKNTPK